MATFIELVNDVERESGTIAQNQRLTTVVAARGRQEKIVNWTARAWEMIQRERPDWTFLRARFTASLTPNVGTYSAADLAITDFGGWQSDADGYAPFTLYDPALGRGDESRLRQTAHRNWLDAYDVGTHPAQRPMWVAQGFDRSLNLGPFPDKDYTLRGWYRRSVQTLTLDADEPFIAPEFHSVIVYRALILMNENEEGQFQIATAAGNYSAARSAMIRAYTEAIET